MRDSLRHCRLNMMWTEGCCLILNALKMYASIWSSRWNGVLQPTAQNEDIPCHLKKVWRFMPHVGEHPLLVWLVYLVLLSPNVPYCRIMFQHQTTPFPCCGVRSFHDYHARCDFKNITLPKMSAHSTTHAYNLTGSYLAIISIIVNQIWRKNDPFGYHTFCGPPSCRHGLNTLMLMETTWSLNIRFFGISWPTYIPMCL